MKTNSIKARFSFQTKVLVPVVIIMVLLVAITMWVVNSRIGVQLEERAADDLNTASKIVKKTQEHRADNLLARYRNVVNETRFKAITQLGHVDTASQFLADLLAEFKEQDGASKEGVKIATL